MADVRSLLRNERAARRINHPQAQYSVAGVLSCRACGVAIKADTLWQQHLTSAQHINTLKRLASGLKIQSSGATGTKRKAEDEGLDRDDGLALRKRPRALEEGREDYRSVQNVEPTQEPSPPAEPLAAQEPEEPVTKKAKVEPTVDEEEWAAFERDVATPPPDKLAAETLTNRVGAYISAAPVSVAELAAKSREEASVQAKERREVELEGEKEDAQRRLEEEFDQMEELEERVRKLKEKREALRTQMLEKQASTEATLTDEQVEGDHSEHPLSEDESDIDDDWGDWGRL